MSNYKFSIVTCTYNSEKFLEKCLDSIENQSYKNIEHIFNDGFSSDRTLNIISEYIKRNEKKYEIKFFQSEPKGVANALNTSLPLITGDIVHFLHSDDYYFSCDSLKRINNLFSENFECKWITGDLVVEFKGRKYLIPVTKILKLNTKRALSFMNFISHENTFVKKELLKDYGGFSEENHSTVEYRLWLRIIKDYKPIIIGEPFTVFIMHKGSTSAGSPLKFTKGLLEGFKVIRGEKYFPGVGYIEDEKLYQQLNVFFSKIKNFIEDTTLD